MLTISMTPWRVWFELPVWQTWFLSASYLVLALMLVVLMAQGALRLRTAHGSRSVSISICVFAYLLCLVGSAGSLLLSREMHNHARKLATPPTPIHLAAEWGTNLASELRTRYSQDLASFAFIDSGVIVNYIDAAGTLRPYVPSASDRDDRAAFLRHIKDTERAAILLLLGAFGWFFAPWAGLAIAYTPWLGQRLRPLLPVRQDGVVPRQDAL